MIVKLFTTLSLLALAGAASAQTGCPVKVGGIFVRPGDLIHADKHGVLIVPKDIAPGIPQAAADVAEREQRILSHCNSQEFSVERLKTIYDA